ncbi:hypothetical protein SUGI_0055340 [Cryptomeria japonica]|nr:hypothetical protein SUGI_0055340 [Cryptomeria japonica]
MDNVCRALVSSAIHRCQATDRLCRITIAIKYPGASKSSSSTTFQISISDTGRGINLPEFLLSYSNINLHRANDIFFSSPQCWDGELSIKTTDMEKTEVQHFWLNWGESRVVQVGTSSKGRNTFSGTEASFSVQGNLEEFIVYIKDLCQKIAILQIPSIALDLCLEPFDNSETCCENIFMWNEGILLPKSMSKIDRLAKGTVDYRINNMQKLDNQVQGPLAFRECFKVGRGSVYSLEANTKMEIVFEVVLVLEIAKDTNKSCSTESTIKAKMKTYAPDLSRSISGLIMSSNDMNFKEECAHIVGVSLEDLCQEKLLSCINKKILDVINITDRNPTKRTANTDVQPTCEEPSKEECEDEVDNENNLDEYTSIWDFL